MSFSEKMLWMCVLRRSVFDYVLYKGIGKHRRRWQSCRRFIFGGAEGEQGLTFEEICGLFGWEPEYLKRLTKGLTRGDIKKLEAMKFKESFDEGPIYELARSVGWESGGSVPFIAPFNYAPGSREHMRLKPLAKEQRLRSFVPMVRWTALATP